MPLAWLKNGRRVSVPSSKAFSRLPQCDPQGSKHNTVADRKPPEGAQLLAERAVGANWGLSQEFVSEAP
jgi:hypothetical protein